MDNSAFTSWSRREKIPSWSPSHHLGHRKGSSIGAGVQNLFAEKEAESARHGTPSKCFHHVRVALGHLTGRSWVCLFFFVLKKGARRIRPRNWGSSDTTPSVLARVNLLSLRTLLALHVTAPADLTLARTSDYTALNVVSPSAADAVAVFVFVTFPSGRPGGEPAI